MLLWGAVYGLSLGAGIGAVLHLATGTSRQRDVVKVDAKRSIRIERSDF
jgi:hypothetical protein